MDRHEVIELAALLACTAVAIALVSSIARAIASALAWLLVAVQ